MNDYLETFLSILPESERQRFLATLSVEEDLSGRTEEEYEQSIRELLERIGKKEVTMRLRPQEDTIDSNRYNQVLREVYTDLHNIYQEYNNLDRIITNHHYLDMSVISQVKKDIKRLERRIEMINLLADNNEGFISASHEGFIDNTLWEPRSSESNLYDSNIPIALRDEFDNTLKLGMSSRFNRIDKSTKIEIISQVGQGFRGSTEYHIGKAIDDNPESFWAEVILADEPLKVPMGGVNEGAICQFKVTFSVPSTVSYIGFHPYTQYPMEIVSVGYTTDDTDNIHGYVLPLTDEPRLISSEAVYDFPEVTAKSLIVTVRQRHATHNRYQVSKSELYNKEMWSKIYESEFEATTSITDWIREDGSVRENEQISQKAIDQFDATWSAYQEALRRYKRNKSSATLSGLVVAATAVMTGGASLAIPAGLGVADILSGRRPRSIERVNVDKYEYVYGLYDFVAEGREYNDSGIYISKPHMAEGNIVQVSLDAKEDHPIFRDAAGKIIEKHGSGEPLRRTSVEYYVTHSENPSEEDWVPILPLGQISVNNELLTPQDPHNPRATLRFSADLNKEIALFKNEERIPETFNNTKQWWFDENNTIVISRYLWDPSSKWTIDYTPLGDPQVVDFTEHAIPIDIVEEFDGADKNGRIILQHYPHIDYKRLREDPYYNPVKIEIEGVIKGNQRTAGRAITRPITSIIDTPEAIEDARNQPAVAKNVTLYKENALPDLKHYSPIDDLPSFEYCHDGKNVYLSESFRYSDPESNHDHTSGNAKIRVTYQYLVPGVRAKIILRRTSDADKSATPVVNSYTLKFKTIS